MQEVSTDLSLRLEPVADLLQQQLVVLHVLEHLDRNHSVCLPVELRLGQVEGVDVTYNTGK